MKNSDASIVKRSIPVMMSAMDAGTLSLVCKVLAPFSRIARIIEEVNGEKIDIVKYDKDPAVFIAKSLQPAKNLHVIITDPKKQECIVVADDENFSLAIGKKGQNAKLASKLTHYKIDIKNMEQAREIGINFKD